jgi:hypothetical protein
MRASAPADVTAPAPTDPDRETKRVSGEIKRVKADPGPETALNAEGSSTGKNRGSLPEDLLADRMEVEAAPAVDAMLDQIEAMLEAAGSLAELREMLRAGFPGISPDALADVIALGLLAANGAGRATADQDAEGATG